MDGKKAAFAGVNAMVERNLRKLAAIKSRKTESWKSYAFTNWVLGYFFCYTGSLLR